MLPLSEHTYQPVTPKRKAPRSNSALRKIAQLDGGNDSDDDDDKVGIKDDPDIDDEDAINSDLDDPDDNVPDETEEEGNQGEVMLCTYDKVQRVKNKWKCTLKDGVLTTGGREYVLVASGLLCYRFSAHAHNVLDMFSTKLPASSNGEHNSFGSRSLGLPS